MIKWNKLSSDEELDEVVELSNEVPCLIFKHSIRCSLSSMMLSRFEKSMDSSENLKVYLLDLINNRPLSNKIANIFGVEHESPQILLLQNGKCTFNASHTFISADSITEAVKT